MPSRGRGEAVVLWLVGPSVVLVHWVFQSRGLDYRLVAAGALLPLVVDAPTGRYGVGHSLTFTVGLLAVVMVATIGRSRLQRRRLICLPIGSFCGLVLSGAFLHDQAFLWPFLGWSTGDASLWPPLPVVVLLEAAGAAVVVWAYGRYGLAEPGRRRQLLRDGRLVEVHR